MINEKTLQLIQQYLPVIVIISLTYAVVFLSKQNAKLYEDMYRNERELRQYWQDAYIRTDPARYSLINSRVPDDDTTVY